VSARYESEDAAARALFDGQIGDAEYVRRTVRVWRGIAQYVYQRNRRRLPAWVGLDDVEQEVLLIALRYVRKWDPERATGTIGQFLRFVVPSRARRILDGWRGASKHNGEKRGSRAELAFSSVFGDGDPLEWYAESVPATQEASVESDEGFAQALAGCVTVREACVLLALRRAGGSPIRAAALLYGDFGARVECRIFGDEHARRVVSESVSRIAARECPDADLPHEDILEDLACVQA
jgi:hypothetical protein